MTGKAQIWYYGVERNRGVPTWPQFAESVRRRFGSLTRSSDAFRELIQLRHTGSVAEYREEFLGLVDRCDGVTQPQQVAFFTAGRCDPLRAVRTSSSSSRSAPNRAQIGRPTNRLSTAGKTTG